MTTETKVIYHIDDEETPYLVKIPIPPERVTLSDFKNILNRPNFKYFFKALDDDFGVVKEEIIEDSAKLPIVNGRVVSWLVTADSSSNQSDGGRSSQSPISNATANINYHGPLPRTQHNNNNNASNVHHYDQEIPHYAGSTCSESTISSHPINFSRFRRPIDKYKSQLNNKLMPNLYENSSTMLSSSDVESSTIYSRMRPHMAHSECSSSISRLHVSNTRKKSHRRRRQRMQPTISRTSSYSSITDSSMSLNIITVNLKLDKVNFLGISIVGHCNKSGDRGIYVGSIMKGGAVALDGRIEPGDMILQVNNINFETLTNDEAVKVLREVVQTPNREIKLVVAKCWNQNPKGYFTVPRMEPVRPIDTETWIAHTAAVTAARGDVAMMPRPMSRSTLSSSSLSSSLPTTNELYCATSSGDYQLTINSDMITIVEQMSKLDSGLEIRDRTWLKIAIPNAFIGCDVVDWLLSHVEGFNDRRDAHKYASRMLKAGYIRHTVNKHTFSEQCYYVFASDFTRTSPSGNAIGNTENGGGGTDGGSNFEGGGTGNGSSGTVTTVATATTMMSALKLTPDNLSGVTDCGSLPPPPSTFRNYSNQMEYQQMEPFYNTSSEQTIYGYNHSEASNSSNERLRYSKHSLSISSEESGEDFYDDDEAGNDGSLGDDAHERPISQAQKQQSRNTSEMTGITTNKNSSRHYLLTA